MRIRHPFWRLLQTSSDLIMFILRENSSGVLAVKYQQNHWTLQSACYSWNILKSFRLDPCDSNAITVVSMCFLCGGFAVSYEKPNCLFRMDMELRDHVTLRELHYTARSRYVYKCRYWLSINTVHLCLFVCLEFRSLGIDIFNSIYICIGWVSTCIHWWF